MRRVEFAVSLLLAGCDVVLGLERDPRFCAQPAQRDAAFCADFDDPMDPFSGFELVDLRDGEVYLIETSDVRSLPNAAALVIAGPGSPDARISIALDLPARFEASFWMNVSTNESNRVSLFRFHVDDSGPLYMTTDGIVTRHRTATGERTTLATVQPPVRDVWFEISLVLDLGDSAMATLELSVAGDPHLVTLGSVADASRRFVLGPSEPAPDNRAGGWKVLCDDVVVRASR